MTGEPWDASYRRDDPAPWDIGRPQPPFVRLAASGGIRGAVLDVGCGTGETALHIAALGFGVLGVDVAEIALAMARAKAADRGLSSAAEFVTADALHLDRLARSCDTVLDCGMFHTFDDDERPRYAASVAAVTSPGGTLCVLCFSDEGADTGPHPISHDDLAAAFNAHTGWTVISIDADRVETTFHEHGAPAWFVTATRR